MNNRPNTRYARIQTFKENNVEELKKFFALCLIQAQVKFPKIRNAFSKIPIYHHPVFAATMSGRRFEQILRCLNCEENENKRDKLSKVRELLELLFCVLFEMLIIQRRNCPLMSHCCCLKVDYLFVHI